MQKLSLVEMDEVYYMCKEPVVMETHSAGVNEVSCPTLLTEWSWELICNTAVEFSSGLQMKLAEL